MARDIPAELYRYADMTVNRLLRTPGPGSEALLLEAERRAAKPSWTVTQWKALLAELDSTDKTVGEWLQQ